MFEWRLRTNAVNIFSQEVLKFSGKYIEENFQNLKNNRKLLRKSKFLNKKLQKFSLVFSNLAKIS